MNRSDAAATAAAAAAASGVGSMLTQFSPSRRRRLLCVGPRSPRLERATGTLSIAHSEDGLFVDEDRFLGVLPNPVETLVFYLRHQRRRWLLQSILLPQRAQTVARSSSMMP